MRFGGAHNVSFGTAGALSQGVYDARLVKRIQDLLAITKLLTVFETYETEQEAIGSFKG